MTRWLHWSWYQYLFERKRRGVSWFTVVRCRMQGHPCGVCWYNVGGLEPDMTCKECGDDLG